MLRKKWGEIMVATEKNYSGKRVMINSDAYFSNGIPFYIDRCDYMDYEAIQYHCHEFIEIAYVYNGKGTHVLDGREYVVSKGDLFIINIDVPHSFYPIDANNTDRLIVMNCIFVPEFIEKFNIELPILNEIIRIFLYKSFYPGEAAAGPDICFAGEAGEDIGRIFDKMYMEYKIKNEGYKEMIKIQLCELLIEIYRRFMAKNSLLEPCEAAKYELMGEVLRYLEENYSQRLNVSDISRQAYMSKSHFSFIFKEATGLSVIDYLQKIRIEKACKLLSEHPEKPVAEIACCVGYQDYKFFNHIFKRVTGMTAREYRNKSRA